MPRHFEEAILHRVPAGIESCEHCRTVTWAGVPACSCEFGRLVASAQGLELILAGGDRPLAKDSEIS